MSDVELRLVADVDQAIKGVGVFSKEYRELVRTLAKPLKQANTFRELERSLEGTERQMRVARERVRDLGNELARTAEPSKQLTGEYRDAVSELRRLERAEGTAQQRLAARRRELRAAGVDTSNLAAEQRRLSQEMQKTLADGRADQQLRAAQKNLGVGEIEQTQRELAQLRSEYRLVTADGNLSTKQRAEAEANYRRSVSQTLASLRQLRAAAAPGPGRAEAQAALQAEARAAAEAAAQTKQLTAQRALGVGKIQEAQQALVKLREQYRLVMSDGNLSAKQRAEAETAYHRRVQQTLAELRKMRSATAEQESQAQRALAAEVQRRAAARAGIRAQSAAIAQATREQRLASVEAARNSLGVTQSRAARLEIESLRQQFNLLRTSGSLATKELAIAQRELKRRIRETKDELRGLEGGFSGGFGGIAGRLRGGGGAAAVVAGVAAAGAGAVKVAQGADEVSRLDARLRLATKSQQEFNTARAELDRIADATQGDITGLVDLYSRLQRPLSEVGLGQRETLQTVEAVSLALKIGGSSAAEADGAVRQLSQALASGVLRGDEFNSVLEQSDRVAGALADELGVTVGQLREMAGEGKLTTETIVKAFGNQLPRLREEYSKFAPELGAAFDRLLTETKRYWGRQAKESGITDYLATAINDMAKNTNRFAQLEGAVQEEVNAQRQKDLSNYSAYIADLDALRKKQIKAAEDAAKALVSAEKTAISDLQKVRDERLKIDQRYQQALASIQGGPDGAPSLMQHSALKRGAQAALDNGDIAGAQQQAQAALKVLQDLAAAGESTVGFSFFVRELRDIELAANDLEQSNAEDKLASIRDEMQQLKDQAAQLKELPVSVKADEASIEQVRSQIETLVAQLGQQEVVIPVRVVHPDAPIIKDIGSAPQDVMLRDLQVPQFATGGLLRGPGTGTSDSILARLSNGEFVMRADAVRHYGSALLQQINSRQLPRFADGGLVSNALVPTVPMAGQQVESAVEASRGLQLSDYGWLGLDLGGGQTHEVLVHKATELNLRRLAAKFGGSFRRVRS